MSRIHRYLDPIVQVSITQDLGKLFFVQQVHQLGIHASLRKGKEGIQENPSRFSKVHNRSRINFSLLLKIKWPCPVKSLLNKSEAICLNNVPVFRINDEP